MEQPSLPLNAPDPNRKQLTRPHPTTLKRETTMTTETIEASDYTEAEAITNKYVSWAMGAGLIPVPIFDLAAIVGVQVKMLSEISKYYGKEFSENRVKSIVLSLVGGLGATAAATGIVASIAKSVPGLGSLFGFATLPLVSGAITYAVGKVFIQHFESGGTFLTFDAAATRAAFVTEFKLGKSKLVAMGGKLDSKVDALSDTIESKLRPSS